MWLLQVYLPYHTSDHHRFTSFPLSLVLPIFFNGCNPGPISQRSPTLIMRWSFILRSLESFPCIIVTTITYTSFNPARGTYGGLCLVNKFDGMVFVRLEIHVFCILFIENIHKNYIEEKNMKVP